MTKRMFCNLWKEKWSVAFSFLSNYFCQLLQWSRRGWRRKCPNWYLVTCARRHLEVNKAFPITSWHTVGSKNTFANSVTSHLVGTAIWRRTPSFTPERNRTSAHNVTSHLVEKDIWILTPSRTLGRNRTLAHTATSHLQVKGVFHITSRHTVGSRSSVVFSVTSHLLRTAIWRPTPSFTQGRNRTVAHTATSCATQLPTSKGISRSTLGTIFTNAINALCVFPCQ